jgi:hypothetical protein
VESFQSVEEKKDICLHLREKEVCSINLPPLVGARYILTFIDDLSHFTWVYFLNNKNLVVENFKEFRAFVENKCGRPIKCLITNNGSEYVNRSFEEYSVLSSIDW